MSQQEDNAQMPCVCVLCVWRGGGRLRASVCAWARCKFYVRSLIWVPCQMARTSLHYSPIAKPFFPIQGVEKCACVYVRVHVLPRDYFNPRIKFLKI